MANKLFGIDIQKVVADAMKGNLIDGVLIQNTSGSRTAGSLTGGVAVSQTEFAFEGIIDDYNENLIDGTSILQGDRKILIVGGTVDSLVVPKVGDSISMEGLTYNIINIKRDPAAATYSCQARLK